jgi:ribonuclease E
MAGLIVIDFIDMEQSGHVRKVEKAMKEALKNDRARIQVGRISSFGLMEMSRQRLRTGVLEASTKPCPHCDGTGLMRTAASAGLAALRIIEDEAARGRGERILLRAGREAAVYVLNKKRAELAEIEQSYGVSVEIAIDEAFEGARMTVESSGPRPVAVERPAPVAVQEDDEEEMETALAGAEELDEGDEEEEAESRAEEGERPGRRRRRRRRGGRGRRRDAETPAADDETTEAGETAEARPEPVEERSAEEPGGERVRRRRRRRGRKGAPDESEGTEGATAEAEELDADSSPMVERPVSEEPPIAETAPTEEPKPKRRRSKKAEAEAAAVEPEPVAEAAPEPVEEPAPKARRSRKKSAQAAAGEESVPVPAANNDEALPDEGDEPRRSGWWQRTFG